MNKQLSIICASLAVTAFIGVNIVFAQDYTPLAPLPGTTTGGGATTNLSAYLSGMIKLLIALGGAFSILMAIIGGTQYIAAGSLPDAKSGAKERIQNALVGLALVLSSYLILNSINPKLVKFEFMLPPVGTPPIAMTPTITEGMCPSPNDSSGVCCPPGVNCKACSGCSVVSGVQNKGCGVSTCFLNSSLLSKIKNVSGVTGWRITESWPPTVNHISMCHQNGTCADLNNSGGATDPATIKKYYDAFKSAGLTVLYESKNCTPYIDAGITNCKTYSTMTNHSSFHVE